MQSYVFGYGSLMNVASAGRAVGRLLSPSDLIPVRALGYRRVWSLKELVLSEMLGRPVTAVFLDLEPAAGRQVNGVLIAVSAAELDNLMVREKNYDCADFTMSINPRSAPPLAADSRVFTFLAKPEQKAFRDRGEELYVMSRYVTMVEAACREIGMDFLHEYQSTTEEISFPMLGGKYTFLSPDQAKYV
jgi:cation transport regulator ChaC